MASSSTASRQSPEELILALLPPQIRQLSLQFAFGDYHNFIGKKHLMQALLSALPMQDLYEAGIPEQKVRALVNELFKNGLVKEIIEEGKRRKDEDCSQASGRFSPHFLEMGNPVSPAGRNQGSVYSEDGAPELSLRIPQSFSAAGFDALSSDNPSPYSPLYTGASTFTTCTPLDLSLQYYIFRVLQENLEIACYVFAKCNLQCIFWNKRKWEYSPHAAELNKWTKEIMSKLNCTDNDVSGWTNAYDSNTATKKSGLKRDLNKILSSIAALRHDAVHRKDVDAEKLLWYVQLGLKMVENFLAWGGGILSPSGIARDPPSGIAQAVVSQQQPQETHLLQLQQNFKTLEENLETVIREFEKESSMRGELPSWEGLPGTHHDDDGYKYEVSRDLKGVDALLETLARMSDNWFPNSGSASSTPRVSQESGGSSSKPTLHDQTPRYQHFEFRWTDDASPSPSLPQHHHHHHHHQRAQSFSRSEYIYE